MGAKKELRKKDSDAKIYSIDDSLNSGSWKCVVAMAVEKTFSDSFVLKAYSEEAMNGRRQQVKLINYDAFVMKILNDFASGKLRYKYAFLLNFSSVFQEAAACVSNKVDIPVALLAKVVKALLLYLKEESLARAERKISGPVDPIQAMAERPANVGGTLGSKSKSKKELPTMEKKKQQQQPKTGNDKLTLRPPSMSKQDTKLSKRGEGIKEDECIDDAPDDGFFHLYVLLTGFYHPEFPLELIKAGVPLHMVLCVDTSLSEVKTTDSEHHSKTPKRNSENRSEEIQHFWESFLKVLWTPHLSSYFNDTIFQVYEPKKLTCNNLKEFIYGEISYLMYDVSDFTKKLGNYLHHMKLWYVNGESKPNLSERYIARMVGFGDECATASVILRQITEVVSEEDVTYAPSTTASTGSDVTDFVPSEFYISQSVVTKRGSSSAMSPPWSQLLSTSEDADLLSIYLKAKQLDYKYGLKEDTPSESLQTELTVQEERLDSCLDGYETGVLASRWKNIEKRTFQSPFPVPIDYSLYLLLLTKVLCFYDSTHTSGSISGKSSTTSSGKNFNFKQIENGDDEMRKPHFTVTQGSRHVVHGTPPNVKEASRDFFSPSHFKLVTPEMLKACSAPQFRSLPKPNVERSIVSELTYPLEYFQNSKLTLFENLRKFLGEQMFDQVKGFDFFEELSNTKLLARENHYVSRYNCIDSSYSIVSDALCVVFHNRKGSDGIHHDTFNGALKTAVGLRDFYDYILEDEADWFREQEKFLRPKSLTLTKPLSQEHFSYNCTDSDFWLEKSIKYQENLKLGSRRNITGNQTKEKKENEEIDQNNLPSSSSILGEAEKSYSFYGYDISKAAVQFSGFKTEYHGNDCSMTVELLERLYGDQHLGIHAFLAGHTLHLYSYVCPKPHLDHPYTFHLLLQSGMVLAFSERRIQQLFPQSEETIESTITTADENQKTTPALPATESIKKTIQIPKTIADNEFAYDMKLSLPNGLNLTTVRKAVKPCYIKQQRLDISRLVLPNGNVVEMTRGRIKILKGDATVVTSHSCNIATKELPDGTATTLENYHVITPEGIASTIERGRVVSRQKLTLFQNTDLETTSTYFRRGDKTSYMFQKNGTMCVQFKDGTKISTTPFLRDQSAIWYDDVSFVFVEIEVTVEHPDFATLIYNSLTQSWKILLPFNTSIAINSDGTYVAQLDGQIELRVDQEQVEMKSSLDERQVPSVTADLTVFSDGDGPLGRIYCKMTDSSGKTFAVEPNAACYILNHGEPQSKDGGNPGEDLLTQTELKLSRNNKYMMVRRDATAFELFHTEDVRKLMASPTPGMVVFAPEIPNAEFRLFVFIFPAPPTTEKHRRWQVESVLPDPTFVPGIVKTKITTTYGVPPSWMHPYPKRKQIFQIPSPLMCRIFLEINRTDLEPQYGPPDCSHCLIEDTPDTKFSKIDSNKIQECINRLSGDDQDILRDMYVSAVREGMNAAKPKPAPEGSEALKRYLDQSQRLAALQKFHQKSIRYHIVPNYFEHPIGMSWLILNHVLDGLTCPEDHKKKPARSLLPSPRYFKSQSTFSNEEIEYDLQTTTEQSYSDLTCRTNLSLKSAPPILISGNICTCKVRPAAVSESAPAYKMKDGMSSESKLEVHRERVCAISRDYWMEPSRGKPALMTLSNLMSLGLI